MLRRLVAVVAFLAFLGAAAAAGLAWLHSAYDAPGPSPKPVTVVIPKGAHLAEIAELVAKGGAVDSVWLMMAQTFLSGSRGLRAGEYAIPAHASIATILDLMRRGQVVVHRLTVPEGLTVHQVLALVESADAMRGGLLSTPAEGTLLPQTYFYLFDDPRDALVSRMATAMTQAIDSLWSARAPGLPFADKGQALALASIVERETSIAAERPHIAAVFENRLRLHMKLESDPTVIYAASNGDGTLDRPISRADLGLASPYNTYLNEGLPPSPICNPGRASIEAVLHPSASDDLYFVADGTGGHAFARTLSQHNKNVEHWRSLEKNQGNGKGE